MKLIVLSFTALLLVGFTNCSNVDFAQDVSKASALGAVPVDPTAPAGDPATGEPGSNDPSQPPPDVAIANCAQAKAAGLLKSKSTTITFADTKTESGKAKVCEFAESPATETASGNLTQLNNYLRSRYEQTQKVQLPNNAVICNVEMKTTKQTFKYDDVFYLTFNDRVLATNLERSLSGLKYQTMTAGNQSIPVYLYQWIDGVRNKSFAGVNETANDYCLGSDKGLASCSWPLSQQTGDIKFNFDQNMLISIGVTAPANNQKFGFIMTGDNDPSVDCYHEELKFDATVSYYVQ